MNSPFRGSDAIAAGLLSRHALESRAWRRLFRDVYMHADIELTHLVRCQAAATRSMRRAGLRLRMRFRRRSEASQSRT